MRGASGAPSAVQAGATLRTLSGAPRHRGVASPVRDGAALALELVAEPGGLARYGLSLVAAGRYVQPLFVRAGLGGAA